MSRVATAPLIWALIGPKHGDNAQVRALAAGVVEALAARCISAHGGAAQPPRQEERVFRFHAGELLVHAWPVPTLAGVARGGLPVLGPPWPDLVISAGRRSEPVAQWIRRSSGGRSRLVHLGRPWSAPAQYDLVITSSQYAVPPAANVLELALPLAARVSALPGQSTPGAFAEVPFAGLPRPWTGVLLGGDSGFLLFDADRARLLADRLRASRAATGGTLVITGSPRTPPAFLDELARRLDGPIFLHRWAPDVPNPYRQILALADVLVVTSDSVSMVVEAIATGKPVYLHDVAPRGRDWWQHGAEYRWRALSHRLVQRWAPDRFRRDIRRIHDRLVADGAARWFDGVAVPFKPVPIDPARDLALAIDRVCALLLPSDQAGRASGGPGGGASGAT